jgi:hypothetical protein
MPPVSILLELIAISSSSSSSSSRFYKVVQLIFQGGHSKLISSFLFN